MNSREYIQILKESVTTITRDDVSDAIIDAMNALRETHKKLQIEYDYYLVYCRHDLKVSDGLITLIKNHCDEFGFKYIFTAFDSTWFKKGYFARYYLNGKDITNLIVFRKQDNKRETKPIDDININDL